MIQMMTIIRLPELFVDTSGWATLVDPSQILHIQMRTLYRNILQQKRRLVTSNYILSELVALLISPMRISRPSLVTFVEGIKTSPYIEVVHIDATLDQQAWDLFKKRPDKKWTLVDCSSFVLMQQRGITEAITNDHHFEQAGFIRLLKS